MELSEFLLARISEDEEWAGSAWREQSHAGGCDTCGASFPRLLTDCEAKRRIVEWLLPPSGLDEEGADLDWAAHNGDRAQQVAIGTLRLLALPYADHPDYDEAWRP